MTPVAEDLAWEASTTLPVARALAAAVLPAPVREIAPIDAPGAVNLAYTVSADDGEWVLRLNRDGDDSGKALGDYRKEAWCLERAASAGVPGPRMRALGDHEGRAWCLQNRVPGVNGKRSDLPAPDLLRVLGRYARAIHEIPVDGFGDDLAGFTSGNGRAGWLGWVDYNLGELTASDPLIGLGVYAPADQPRIRDTFHWLRSLDVAVGLNHGDLARRNTVVGPQGVFLLDWGCAEMHVVPHYDLNALRTAYALDPSSWQAFLDGYGIDADAWERLRPEVDALGLLKAFDLVRWAIDRCPERIEELAAKAAAATTTVFGP